MAETPPLSYTSMLKKYKRAGYYLNRKEQNLVFRKLHSLGMKIESYYLHIIISFFEVYLEYIDYDFQMFTPENTKTATLIIAYANLRI